ncbi:MAG: sugar ABC transporter permease [Clostridia bacterium]|nr:sugar ABC transporter permease [Clostridia bacterium]
MRNKSVAKSDRELKRKETLRAIKRYKYLYIMLIPTIISIFVFRYMPIYGIQLAFKEFNPALGITKSPWIGLANFERLVSEPGFLNAFKNTIIISLMKVLGGFTPPIILAVLFNEIRSLRYKKIMQTIYTFPNFISWVVMAGIITNLFSGSGLVNQILTSIGLEKQNLLTEPSTFRMFILITAIWKGAGWGAIYYMAAIAGIDTSLYEAAEIDGANRWQKIWHVTLPGIREMIAIQFIMSFSGLMQAGFDQIFNLYNSSLFEVADIIDTYVYRISFQQTPSYGFSVAVGMFTGVINLVLLLVFNQLSKLGGGKGLFEGGVRKS